MLAAATERPKLAAAAGQAVNRRLRIAALRLEHEQALHRSDLRAAEEAVAELAGEQCESDIARTASR